MRRKGVNSFVDQIDSIRGTQPERLKSPHSMPLEPLSLPLLHAKCKPLISFGIVVWIAPVGVRVPVVAATKMDIGKTPCTECAPMVQNRTLVEDQLIKAEIRLYKKKKMKKMLRHN